MDPGVAEKLQIFFDSHFEKDTGNMCMVIGSSMCGKSTLLCEVFLPLFSQDNGFMTTVMSKNPNSLPMKKMILNDLHKKKKKKKVKEKKGEGKGEEGGGAVVVGAGESSSSSSSSSKGKAGGGGGGKVTTAKEMSDVTSEFDEKKDFEKCKNWIFSLRGYDSKWILGLQGLQHEILEMYDKPEDVKKFKFAVVLDDIIDVKGSFMREIVLTWRNKGFTVIQCVQDFTNLDAATRNSSAFMLIGYVHLPGRRMRYCEDMLSAYIPGMTMRHKSARLAELTENKCFIFLNHQLRKCYHINTLNGSITEMPEITEIEEDAILSGEKSYLDNLTNEGLFPPFK